MDRWVEVAFGPAFEVAAALFVLGCLYRVGGLVLAGAARGLAAWSSGARGPGALVSAIRAPSAVRSGQPGRGLRALGAGPAFLVPVAGLVLFGHGALVRAVVPFWPTLLDETASAALGVGLLVLLAAVGLLAFRARRRMPVTAFSPVGACLVGGAALALGLAAGNPSLFPVDGRLLVLGHVVSAELFLVQLGVLALSSTARPVSSSSRAAGERPRQAEGVTLTPRSEPS